MRMDLIIIAYYKQIIITDEIKVIASKIIVIFHPRYMYNFFGYGIVKPSEQYKIKNKSENRRKMTFKGEEMSIH